MTLEHICLEIERDLCRICLKNDESLKCMYDLVISHGDEVPLVDFLNNITNLEYSKSDGYPDTICIKCIESITSTYALIKLCTSSHEKLKYIKDHTRSQETVRLEVINDHNYDGNGEDVAEQGQEKDVATNEKGATIKEAACDSKVQCSSSGESFNTEQKLVKHMKVHEKATEYKCQTCSKIFRKLSQLTSHMRVHVKQKPFQCDICGKHFVYEYLLKQHSYQHSDEKPFPCPKCDKGCTTKQSLHRHMVVHSENYMKPKHKCEICGKEFPYPSFLTEHMKNHTGEKPFLCSICGKGYRQSGALGCHLRSHMGIKPFKCELCDNYFMSAGILRVHMRIHTNERPFVCDICGMAFRQSTDMKSHRRNHLGERRVLCFICGKRLATTGQLTVHLRSHTGEKPYKCGTCSKAFATRTMLVKHNRIHTGERPYSCNVCSKSFNQRSTLKTHLNIHKLDNIKDNIQEDKIIIDEIVDSKCIIIDQDIGTQYSIETVKTSTDFIKTEINVDVLPSPVPLL